MKQAVHFLAALLAVTACSGPDQSSVPTGDPQATINPEMRGYLYGEDVLLSQTGDLFWAQQALSEYARAHDQDIPAAIARFPAATCDFEKPSADAHVARLHVSAGMQPVALFKYSERDIGERADKFVEYFVKSEGKNRSVWKYDGSDQFKQVNVIVTERNKPVYLVLTSQSQTLWNIQSAPDTRIENIAIISSAGAALANAPADTPVQALTGRRVTGCKVIPARTPEDHWHFVQNVKGASYGQDVLKENNDRARAYTRWLVSQFGVFQREELLSPLGASNFLVGPIPATEEQRLPYQPIAGTELLASSHDYLLATTYQGYRQQMVGQVLQMAKEAAVGDINQLLGG